MNEIDPWYSFQMFSTAIRYWMSVLYDESGSFMDNLFWAQCAGSASRIDMLEFYGCLDSGLL